MHKRILLSIIVLLLIPSLAWSVEVYRDGDRSLDIGFWGQAWYQWAEDARDGDGDGIADDDLNDFMIRRSYLSIKGKVTPMLGFFVHYAADRVGQDGLDTPGMGLGTGLAVRDAWMTAKLLDESLMLQVGRMYVPFTRNYGTTSTKALLTTDLDWTQGGVRGGIFYPSKVGRDDGVCLWGNVIDDRLQYRLMVSEGVEGNEPSPLTAGYNTTTNRDDNLRFVGRVSVSLLDPEKGWFNQGTYPGKKSILSIGAGIDHQPDLTVTPARTTQDYTAWTVDLHYDEPIGEGGVTLEAAYIDINNGSNGINYTRMAPGEDATIISVKAGFLFPAQIQPFVHYEKLNMENGNADTDIYGGGFNYFIKGHANKVSLDVIKVDQEEETAAVQDHHLVTLQMAVGF
jgi:hypothetical protein